MMSDAGADVVIEEGADVVMCLGSPTLDADILNDKQDTFALQTADISARIHCIAISYCDFVYVVPSNGLARTASPDFCSDGGSTCGDGNPRR
jgi:hypothetical protein